ncbi:hypothetical protein ACFWVB_20070 [Streptomyces microflavus]|uniref:hypothetical protein n=1 Tax=Streptomyces microflavus TaxID=1919 RepID=UPI00364DC931
MTPPQAPQSAPAVVEVVLHPGPLRTDWCHACKADTRITADLVLLTPGGLSTVGALSWCEVCEDPDCPLPQRRINGG